jgi:mono/diheme cytochrome c family protein
MILLPNRHRICYVAMMMRILLLSLVFVAGLGMALAQAPNGRQQYETRCSRCHGGDATGGESGPNIVARIDARADADLAAFLRIGRPAAGMPAFDLPAPEMSALVAYLRVLVPVERWTPNRSAQNRPVD